VTLPPLLAFYPFESNAQDASGHNRHGTLSSPHSPTVVSGYEELGYYFNGGADYITIPLNINPDRYPRLTMGAWAKVQASGSRQPLLTHDNGEYDREVGLDYRGGGFGWSAFCGTGGVLGAIPNIWGGGGKWVFVAVVYDQNAQTVKLQVDDMVLTKSGVTLVQGLNQMYIGASLNPPLWNDFFYGTIDNVFIFAGALTDQQLAYIRHGGAAAILTAPKGRGAAPFLALLLY
jgi:hypothetical protein